MKVLKDVLKQNIGVMIMWGVFVGAMIIVSLLYDIMPEPLIYSGILTGAFLFVYLFIKWVKTRNGVFKRKQIMANVTLLDYQQLPEPESLMEEDYQSMIFNLGEKLEELIVKYDSQKQESIDYYTAWVHQIKTPIAVMKLKLKDDTKENRELLLELFRIEQYVDMVLQYIRLGSKTTDLLINEYSSEEIIKETLHKFAPQFVDKKLRLELGNDFPTVVTDRKWLSLIIDQFISNAIKYTLEGTIKIYAKENKLYIEDTGIGIAKEDLPRIFEKGYTGNNGRLGEKSSGLGLYLAGKAAELLNIDLLVESQLQKGSTFIIKFNENGIEKHV